MLRFSPARLGIYQLLLRLHEPLFQVGRLALRLDKLFSALFQYFALPLQLRRSFLGLTFLDFGQSFGGFKRLLLLCETHSQHFDGLCLLNLFFFKAAMHLLYLLVETLLELLKLLTALLQFAAQIGQLQLLRVRLVQQEVFLFFDAVLLLPHVLKLISVGLFQHLDPALQRAHFFQQFLYPRIPLLDIALLAGRLRRELLDLRALPLILLLIELAKIGGALVFQQDGFGD